MRYQKNENVKKYLCEYEQILNNMESQMLSVNVVNNITIDFIESMIPHHQVTIYMCENLLKYTYYQPLQQIANNIIQMQTKGIEEMKKIKMTTKGYFNAEKNVKCYMQRYFEITNNMLCRMKNSPKCTNINLNFVGEMIPHHEGAICMCENLLRFCIDPRLKNVAEDIIREQSNGIKQLKEIQERLSR